MRLLLDTHIFVWAVTNHRRLRRAAREQIAAAEAVFVSAASIWEIAIKAQLRRIEGEPSEFAAAISASGFIELPVSAAHAAAVARLPPKHSDPFDRLLLAQAFSEPLRLLTADAVLAEYGGPVEVT